MSELVKAYLENLASDPTDGIYNGRVYLNTTDYIMKFYANSAWRTAMDLNTTQTATNKTLTSPVIDDYFDLNEESAPSTPSAGKVRIYAKSDKVVYTKDSDGTETAIYTGFPSVSGMTNVMATELGYKAYKHGTTYNGGNAPTISLSSGGGSITGIDYSSFRPYQTSGGVWRCRGEFTAAMSSTARTTITFAVNGLAYGSTYQPISGWALSSAVTNGVTHAYFDRFDNFYLQHASGTSVKYLVAFDIELSAKPSWAY